MFRKLKLFIRKIYIMARIPIAINNGSQPDGTISHTWGKYSYGYFDKTNFGANPGGLSWKASYDANAFGANKYFIISDSYTEGIGLAPDTIPSFHVTGNTNNEILYMVKRLHSVKAQNPIINSAQEAMVYLIANGYNQFDADLSNYEYYGNDYMPFNFDFGNLNCDTKETNLVKLYNLVVPASGAEPTEYFQATGTITSQTINANKATHYRRFNVGSFVELQGAGSLGAFNSTPGQPFMLAFRVQASLPASGANDIMSTSTNIKLSVSSANKFIFTFGAVSVEIPYNGVDWETVIIGRNASNQIFITDGTNSQTIGAPVLEMTFDSAFKLGGISATGLINLATFQYWKNWDDLDTTIHSTLEANQTLNRWV